MHITVFVLLLSQWLFFVHSQVVVEGVDSAKPYTWINSDAFPLNVEGVLIDINTYKNESSAWVTGLTVGEFLLFTCGNREFSCGKNRGKKETTWR